MVLKSYTQQSSKSLYDKATELIIVIIVSIFAFPISRVPVKIQSSLTVTKCNWRRQLGRLQRHSDYRYFKVSLQSIFKAKKNVVFLFDLTTLKAFTEHT